MVNYDWELRYYRGCLIAVSSKCIAYALRGKVVILSNIKYVFYHICKYLKGSTKYNTKRIFWSCLEKWQQSMKLKILNNFTKVSNSTVVLIGNTVNKQTLQKRT